MKRLTVLLLAMTLCLGSIGAAKADGVDIKVKGQWDFVFGYTDKDFRRSANGGTGRGHNGNDAYRNRDDRSVARQRVRTQIDFITSEYLSAVLMFEIGDLRWGDTNSGSKTGQGSGADLDADGVNIETKRAYLDWIIPYTEVSVRMGLQGINLPSGNLGNPVFTGDVAGIVVNSPVTDWLSVVAFWARPFDSYYSDFGDKSLDDEMDMFGLLLPMNFTDWGLSFTPWYVYSNVGNASGYVDYVFRGGAGRGNNSLMSSDSATKAWWVGGNLGFTLFDPLEFNLDYMFGRMNRVSLDGNRGLDSRIDNVMAQGWYIGATLDYKLDFMTPGIFGWYASGDSTSGANDNRIGRMPVIAQDTGFKATSFGTHGYYGIGNGNNASAVSLTGTGTWGIGIQLADVTFVKDLKHTLRFAYYRGTNDSDVVSDSINGNTAWSSQGGFMKYRSDPLYLTDDDAVFEVNFDHQYKIYENLTMVLELGYIHLRSDTDTWNVNNQKLKDNDDAWKAELNFRYTF